MAAKIFEVKKKSDGVSCATFIGCERDGPRISHAEPSSKVGSPGLALLLKVFVIFFDHVQSRSSSLPPYS